MKRIRFWLFLGLLIPCGAFGVGGSDFQNASQLLSAARRGDTRTVQYLINSGADINYVDSTGLSLVCTAVMNNDKRTIQILQMYGADASNCDRQIKQYKQRTNVAARGEEYGFFSGLSSSHVVALSALGVAAVIGGVVLLNDLFDSENNNNNSSSGGTRPGGGGGSGGNSSSLWFTVPYGPAYLTSGGTINTSFDVSENLVDWDLTDYSSSAPTMQQTDFMYFQQGTANNYIADGVNELLENYLLVMGGYYGFASDYIGQSIFRDSALVPLKTATTLGGRPVRVALITGNGINPAGSADSANGETTGINYVMGTNLDSVQVHVDKYLNNTATKIPNSNDYDLTEIGTAGYDLSGSGSVFNPFADVNDSALAKIVAGWNGGRSASDGDLYGFVPYGQLAIYRTGNGNVWVNATGAQQDIGTFTDTDTNSALSVGDTITLDGKTFTIQNAISSSSITNPTVTVAETTYQVASTSKMFVGVCDTSSGCTTDTNIAIYVGTDGKWYVNTTGGYDVDAVWAVDSTNNVYVAKTLSNAGYSNFTAIKNALQKYSFASETATPVDVIANVNVIPSSRNNSYVTLSTFSKAETDYQTLINSYYNPEGTNLENQGAVANNVFLGYSSATNTSNPYPMLVMPAGDYLYYDGTTKDTYYTTLDATFENYAPMLYDSTLKHNFMTIVGVTHADGTSEADTIAEYGDDTAYGKLQLSMWSENYADLTNSNGYASRMCGLAGVGDIANGIDPWCFAASGPTAEMATASAAGAVAAVKAAFSYMTNDQIFTLLALTADGPYLNADMNGKAFTDDTLAAYLQEMYEIPADLVPLGVESLSSAEYLNLFKTVYGYGLINVRRAIKPGFSVYRYDAESNSIVAVNGENNRFWGNTSRASSVLSLAGRGAITTAYYDVLESPDGSMSLPRVWTDTVSLSENNKHGLYMGDVLGDFNVDSTNKRSSKIGDLTIDMAVSQRAYNDNLNGLDDMRIAWTNDSFDLATQYQHHLTDGESRFSGRANGVLGLVSDTVSASTMFKNGRFGFGGRAFVGSITDENLLDKDPVVYSQFEPGRLGLANGGAFDTKYSDDEFGLNVSFGVLHENNTVLGMYSDGIFAMNNADTKYIDALAMYKPFDNVKLSLRGTFANTHADNQSEFIAQLSDIKSNAFAFGADVGHFSFTAALPLAVTDGKMGYGYADFQVVENNGKYEVAINNPHMEYVDLSAQKREVRFTTSYKQSLGEFTDAGLGLIYRMNPNNTDVFGNESILMFKIHHRLGI